MKFIAKNFNELTTTELYEILRVRSQIFLLEQNMHCQDIDGIDFVARHFYIEQDGKILAYLRAFYTDETTVRIGRVLTVQHGVGMGIEIMSKAIDDIKSNMKCKKICLDSQKHAIGFYEKSGFKIVSDEFLEEGVVHVAMQLQL